MATDTVRRHRLELAADVTLRTVERRMSSGQCESSDRVIELRVKPVVHRGVALLASRGETEGNVIRRFCTGVLAEVAAGAIGGESGVLSGCGILVARIALDQCMRADQRETVLVFTHRLYGTRPALNVVALLALRAHLAPMDIGVAVRAFVSDLGEDRIHVTLRARDALVHASEREVRLTVIELGDVADRLPPGEGVAILTRDIKRSVRTTRVCRSTSRLLLCLRRLRRCRSKQEHADAEDSNSNGPVSDDRRSQRSAPCKIRLLGPETA